MRRIARSLTVVGTQSVLFCTARQQVSNLVQISEATLELAKGGKERQDMAGRHVRTGCGTAVLAEPVGSLGVMPLIGYRAVTAM
jgi:hypothetical protein